MKKPTKVTKISKEHHYKQFPCLAAYIDRVGAEQLNFRKFMIKKYSGHYYTEMCRINIKPDGSIQCWEEEYKPTEEEAKAIQIELVEAIKTWPKSIGTNSIDELLKITGAKKQDFSLFYSRKGGEIIMAQQRTVGKNGAKNYVPWTFFSDGYWQQLEPDGDLPFWKPPERTTNCASIMIHEGAKTASFCHWLISSSDAEAKALRKSHPWAEELAQWEHWGMIGGAKAPQRTDYNELRSESPTRVAYICDNDQPGKNALQKISESWGESLKGVFFDNRWPESWDLADAFDKSSTPKLFTKAGRYIGPSLRELMFPATYATKTIPNKKGKPTQSIRDDFANEWVHCVHPEVFIHVDSPNREYDLKEFNIMIAPFTKSANTGLLVQKSLSQKTGTLAYNPARKSGLFIDKAGRQVINTYVPSNVVAEKGDCSLWEEYIDHLFPDATDKALSLKWACTLMAHPEIKMHYSMLLISEMQGVGKTTLGQDILAPIVGMSNVSFPSESDIVESSFNGWSAQKRLCIVEEIYAGHNSKAYDRLKSVVTDRSIDVNKKYQQPYTVENYAHVFACSNSFRALKLNDDDRRWLVPSVTEKKKDKAFWGKLHEWLEEENGLGKILQWAIDYCDEHGVVMTGDSAPWTSAKKSVIEETMSQGLLLISNLLDQLRLMVEGSGEDVYLTDIQLMEFIRDQLYDGKSNQYLEKPLTIRKLARSKGWFINDNSTQNRAFFGGAYRAKILCSSPKMVTQSAEKLLESGIKPFDINKLVGF